MDINDALQSALLQGTDLEHTVAKAEDLPGSESIDWSKHYFEPQPGSDYIIKFVPNLEGAAITHRFVYKSLPDPTRRGKTFRYVSNGNPKTCKILDLFFQLNAKKKEGDMEAQRKIEKYLGKSNQAACIVQILASPKPEEVNQFRILSFATFGENATIANMINKKIKPSEAMLKAGIKPVDIFNVFGSPALLLSCRETQIGDNIKGRGYSGSDWTQGREYGCIVTVNGKQHEFTQEDRTPDGKIKPEVLPFFEELVKQLQNPDISIHNYFEYTEPGDPRNTKETEEYIKKVFEKVDEIIPVIRDNNMAFIETYGKKDSSSDSAKTIGGKNAQDILKESAPSELQGSILNQGGTPAPQGQAQAASQGGTSDDDLVASILNK